jgi:hypothetical protein
MVPGPCRSAQVAEGLAPKLPRQGLGDGSLVEGSAAGGPKVALEGGDCSVRAEL